MASSSSSPPPSARGSPGLDPGSPDPHLSLTIKFAPQSFSGAWSFPQDATLDELLDPDAPTPGRVSTGSAASCSLRRSDRECRRCSKRKRTTHSRWRSWTAPPSRSWRHAGASWTRCTRRPRRRQLRQRVEQPCWPEASSSASASPSARRAGSAAGAGQRPIHLPYCTAAGAPAAAGAVDGIPGAAQGGPGDPVRDA